MSVSAEKVRKLLSKLEDLPTLPTVITQLMALIDNPLTTANDINNVIKTDQALTAKTLKLVNSAYYNFPRRIGTVTQAVVILGFNTVRSLALGAIVCKMFSGEEGEFSRAGLWEHSIAVAFAGRIIAKKVRYHDEEEAFVAGILHDIAKVIEDQYFHEEFIEAISRSKAKNIDLRECEKELLGMDHCAIGKRVCSKWNLPETISKVITYHHDPRFAGPHKRLSAIISVADTVVRIRKIGDSANYGPISINKEAVEELKIGKKDLAEYVKLLIVEMKNAADFLQIIKEQ